MFEFVSNYWRQTKYNKAKKIWLRTIANYPRKVVYISFRATEKNIANLVQKHLEENGYETRCWDPDMLFDDPLKEVLQCIDLASAFILIEPTVESPWTKAESAYAMHTKTPSIIISEKDEITKIIEKTNTAVDEYWRTIEQRFIPIDEKVNIIRTFLSPQLDEKTLTSRIWDDIDEILQSRKLLLHKMFSVIIFFIITAMLVWGAYLFA